MQVYTCTSNVAFDFSLLVFLSSLILIIEIQIDFILASHLLCGEKHIPSRMILSVHGKEGRFRSVVSVLV